MTRKRSAFGLLLVILFTAVWGFGRTAWQERQFVAEIRLLAAQGHPVDNAGLERHYQANTSTDATEDWLQAMERFDSAEFKQARLPVSYVGIPSNGGGGPIPDQLDDWNNREIDLAFVQRWQQAIDQLHDLAKHRKPVRVPRTYRGWETDLTTLDAVQHAARMLCLNHDIHLVQGDPASAFKNSATLLRLAELLRQEDSMFGQLVMFAIHEQGLRCLRRALRNHRGDTFHRQEIRTILSLFDDYEKIYRKVAVTERACAIDAIRSRSPLIETNLMLVGSWPSAGRLMLSYYDRMLHVPMSPTLDFMKSTAHMDRDFSYEFEQRTWLAKRDTVIALQATVALHRFAQYLVEQESLARLAELALLLRSFESRTGRLPSDLAELAVLEVDLTRYHSYLRVPFYYKRNESGDAMLWGPDPANWLRHEESSPFPPLASSNLEMQNDNKWLWLLNPAID